jgi:pectin methylesterase-like acyl-CoA thioesterase
MSFNFKKPLSSENISLEFNQKQEVKMQFVVDHLNGPYYTIQNAIDEASSDSHILVETGLYKENLIITTPNIFIQAKSSDS